MLGYSPNRSLLNPKFDGYKLHAISQEDVVAAFPLEYKPTQSTVSTRAPLSFQEVQSRIRHNHLSISPEGRRAVYVDSDFRVVLIDLHSEPLSPVFTVLYDMPQPMQTSSTEVFQKEYPSAVFLSYHVVFASDGNGTLYTLNIGPDSACHVVGTHDIPVDAGESLSVSSPPFRIHSAVHTSDDTAVVLLSARHRDQSEDTKPIRGPGNWKGTQVEFDIYAARFKFPLSGPGDDILPLDIVWHRRGADVPSYTTYDPTLRAFLLTGASVYRPRHEAQPSTYNPTPDEIAPIPSKDENLDTPPAPAGPPKPPPYAWTQDDTEVTIAFPLPALTDKANINVHFSSHTLTVLVSGNSTKSSPLPHYMLTRLWGPITPSSSFWTWDAQATGSYGLLTLHLEKQNERTRWPQVFEPVPNVQIEEVTETMDPSELYNIREHLEKYTATLHEGTDASGLGLGTGVSTLEGDMEEDVDAESGNLVRLTWIGEDGSTPAWAKEQAEIPVDILSLPLPGTSGVSFVVKHTVDGLVYTLSAEAGTPVWKHTNTFSALAFVLASKRDRRFTYHEPSKAVHAFESGSVDYGGHLYAYMSAPPGERQAKESILKVGGGDSGSILGVGAVQDRKGQYVVLCLCEGELIILRDILNDDN
ncbi:CS-domain-containing protein [Dentipellis sp. KUC8613]|nr:CS-domain-containing protein [Dentipellis sp. KUC8613]